MAEYLLIVKKIRDMIVYNNIMLKQFPKHEKYLLANKIRELGYEIFESAVTINKKVQKNKLIIVRCKTSCEGCRRVFGIYKKLVNKE